MIVDGHLTTGQAAGIYQIPIRTLRWAAAHGYILGAQKYGRDWLLPAAALHDWINHRPKPGRKPNAAHARYRAESSGLDRRIK